MDRPETPQAPVRSAEATTEAPTNPRDATDLETTQRVVDQTNAGAEIDTLDGGALEAGTERAGTDEDNETEEGEEE